jgi:cellulose biosynthesis protein BcsQ
MCKNKAMRITFISSKGGTGKSSLCLILAGVLQRAGKNVSVIDMDPQETVTHFADKFDLAVDDLAADFHLVDTPGHIPSSKAGRDFIHAIKDSDRVILVCEKSPVAIHGSSDAAGFIQANKRRSSKSFVLFNKVRPQTAIGKQNGSDLAKLLKMPALKTEIPLTTQIEFAAVEGLSAVKGKVMDSFLNLALEIVA